MDVFVFIFLAIGALLSVEAGKVKKCEKKVDLAIVLDSSASIGEETFRMAKQFAIDLTERFSIRKDKTRVSLVAFSQHVNIKSRFSDLYDGPAVKETLCAIPFEGAATKTHDAMQAVNFEVFSEKSGARRKKPGVKEVAVIVTDGYSFIGTDVVKDQTNLMRNSGIELYAVGITSRNKDTELNVLASKPYESHIFKLNDSNDITSIVDNIVKHVCS